MSKVGKRMANPISGESLVFLEPRGGAPQESVKVRSRLLVAEGFEECKQTAHQVGASSSGSLGQTPT